MIKKEEVILLKGSKYSYIYSILKVDPLPKTQFWIFIAWECKNEDIKLQMKSVIMAKDTRRTGTKTPLCFAPLHRSSAQHLIPRESTLLHISLLMQCLLIIFSATATETNRKSFSDNSDRILKLAMAEQNFANATAMFLLGKIKIPQ